MSEAAKKVRLVGKSASNPKVLRTVYVKGAEVLDAKRLITWLQATMSEEFIEVKMIEEVYLLGPAGK